MSEKELYRDPLSNPVSKEAIGTGFVRYCIEKKWIIVRKRGMRPFYYLSEQGVKALKKFGIKFHEQTLI
jgi:hypothetical protein